jgi:AcrR family transcriptional regulator
MAPKFRRNKEQKINEILDAAVKLSQERGPNNFSINDIPPVANVSIGTVYRYFPKGKKDILRRLLLRNIQRQKDIVGKSEKEHTLEGYWRPILRNMMDVSDEYDAISDTMIEAAPPDSEFYRELSADLMGYYGEMAEEISSLPDVKSLPVENLTLRVGLCFRLLKKVLQAQHMVHLYDEGALEDYLMQIVRATFGH